MRPVVMSRSAATPMVARRWQSNDTKEPEEPKGEAKQETKPDAAEPTKSETPAEENVTITKTALANKDKQIAELKDAYLRSVADMENNRKRHEKQLIEKGDYAITSLARDLVSSIDILTSALRSVPENARSEAGMLKDLYVGLEMTQRELLKTLKKVGLEQFDPTGEKFDPNIHEALFQAPVEGKAEGTVFTTEQVGYMLKGRVLRPAKVGVVKA